MSGDKKLRRKSQQKQSIWKNRQDWSYALKKAFEAPAPRRKKTFLRGIRQRRVSSCQFVLQQASYIRKWAWALSLGVFLTALAGGPLLDKDILWLLSALMPFLAISSVTEYVRAEACGMAELEMATRFCLKSVLLARVGVLGIVHLGTLSLVSLCGYREGMPIFRTGIYLLTPYLLTDAVSLWLVRKIRGREALYACLGPAIIVGILPVIDKCTGLWLWQSGNFGWWLWAAAALCVIAACEWKKSMERMEELTWS